MQEALVAPKVKGRLRKVKGISLFPVHIDYVASLVFLNSNSSFFSRLTVMRKKVKWLGGTVLLQTVIIKGN